MSLGTPRKRRFNGSPIGKRNRNFAFSLWITQSTKLPNEGGRGKLTGDSALEFLSK